MFLPLSRHTAPAVLVAFVAGLGFTGCASDAQTGALIGAGIGAAAGQAIGGNSEGTLIGAAVGGGAGYFIGNEQDKQNQSQVAPTPSTPGGLESQ